MLLAQLFWGANAKITQKNIGQVMELLNHSNEQKI